MLAQLLALILLIIGQGEGEWAVGAGLDCPIYGKPRPQSGSPTHTNEPMYQCMGLIVGMYTDNGSRQLAV